MSYSYLPTSSASAYRPARRDHFNPSGVVKTIHDALPSWATQGISAAAHSASGRLDRLKNRSELKRLAWKVTRWLFTITNGLIILWIYTLWWGERSVFRDSLESCAWNAWEKWPTEATPHHLVFIADPQLVDPHTYPGRPWPLSTLTVKFTDQYMRRSFSSIQSHLDPDSVLFLGDLFDGGREWSTPHSTSPEERYRKYNDDFWKAEFHRFVKIFLDPWNSQETHSTNPRGRRLIGSLPGNHDLGFGSGIQLPVRDRFQNFFGKGNRVDVIGNHTFVSVDTVSLSAMDQPDPKTGSTGAGNGDGARPNQQIWQEPENFLNAMKEHRGRAEMDELCFLGTPQKGRLFKHEVAEPSTPVVYQDPDPEIIGFPAILLTHVPLYRKPATPCGPLRERYPPSSDGILEQDEPNALKLSGGYQYQNVLTQTISNEVVSKVGPNLIHVYSGDDHDYCEITHREFSGSPKEITVKSTSWAMGVRKPGFVLTSLWNPVDPFTGKSTNEGAPGSTLQNHLCLLPDQLSVFIHYGLVLGFTLVVLIIRAIVLSLRPTPSPTPEPILPLAETHELRTRSRAVSHTSSSSISNASFIKPGGLASRATNNPRVTPPHSYNDTYPGLDYTSETDSSKWKSSSTERRRRGGDTLLGRVRHEFMDSTKKVARIALSWYFFLIWRW
ncbi:putative manganese ion homeostasis (Fr) [Aspergillus lucknowensis]|uniref:Calcineurin-like phosphoesterase domain-containing protein n=1 Tax=Aspergillus lucknowensis TaxID=176173 RepID=A0ABR4M0P2_9EURO